MRNPYRKRGWSNRLEIQGGISALTTVRETGRAEEEGGVFRAESESDSTPVANSGDYLRSMEETLTRAIPRSLLLELATITTGSATHQHAAKNWTEAGTRGHLTLVRPEAGARIALEWEVRELDAALPHSLLETIRTLALPISHEPPASDELLLSPSITAALLPLLLQWLLRQKSEDQPIRLGQFCEDPGARDGDGLPIVTCVLTSALLRNSGWPNSYRPSYRFRAQKLPRYLRLETASVVSQLPRLPVAIAHVLPFSFQGGDEIAAQFVLSHPDRGNVSFVGVSMPAAAWVTGIATVEEASLELFPELTECWGEPLLVRGARLHPLTPTA